MEHSRLFKACLLRSIGTCSVVAADTYVYMLFLSSYPQSSIPYLYLTLGLFSFVTMRFAQTYLKRSVVNFMLVSHIIFITLLSSFLFLAEGSWHWGPFVISIAILSMVTIANTTDWIVVQTLFNLREFKAASKWINLSSTIAVVIVGILIPVMLSFFPANSVLYFLIGLFIAAVVVEKFMHTPTLKVEVSPKESASISVSKQPLYLYTFLALLLMLQLYIFADYSFKSELATRFDEKNMGQFLAPFYSVTNAVTIIIQMFVSPAMLRRFGVIGLIMFCPIMFMITTGVLIVEPSLWPAAIFAGVANILRYSFFSVGTQMIYSAYPPAVRSLAQYQMQSFGRSFGVALGGLALILLKLAGADLSEIAMGAFFMAALMAYATIKIRRYYVVELKKSVNLERYDADYLSTEAVDETLLVKTATQALKEQDEDTLLFGLSLLDTVKLKTVPDEVIKALYSPYHTVQIAAINVMKESLDESVVPILMKKLTMETSPDSIEALVGAVVKFSPSYVLPYATTGIDSDHPAMRAVAVIVLLRVGTPEQITKAYEVLKSFVYHSEEKFRYLAARILSTVIVENSSDYILHLINDPDQLVVQTILAAAAVNPEEKIILALINKLEDKSLTYLAGNTLTTLGAPAIPLLLDAIQQRTRPYLINTMILLLGKMSAPEAEGALLDLLKTNNSLIHEVCSISLAYRAKKFILSAEARAIMHQRVLVEVEKTKIFLQCEPYYVDVDIKNEIRSRIFYAKLLYVYFLASYTHSTIILQIIPTLLSEKKADTAYNNAVELLELAVGKQELKDTIPLVMESKMQSINPMPLPDTILDAWLQEVLNFKQGILGDNEMNELISKVMVLRKVSLFASLSTELQKMIAEIVQQKNTAEDEILFKQGDWGDGIYIVAKGAVNLVQDDKLIKICKEGDFFGELSLLDNEPRFATAIADVDSKLYFIEKSEFSRLTDEVPAILKTVVKTVVGYLRQPKAGSGVLPYQASVDKST